MASRNRVAPCVERLEGRRLLSVSYNSGTDTLTVTGNDPSGAGGDDRIEIYDSSGIKVKVNGTVEYSGTDPIDRIEVDGGSSGDDILRVSIDPLPNGIGFDGNSGTDTLEVIGSSGYDQFTVYNT